MSCTVDGLERQEAVMHPSPLSLSSLPAQRQSESGTRRKEDLMYQAITVAAMITVLASAWVF
jgi:hypothetical protein